MWVQKIIDRVVRAGVPLFGARWLEVRGRRSGVPRGVVVNVLELDGATYLYAPRGDTQWVRNLRVAREGTLSGRRVTARDIDGAARPEIQDAYLRRWGWQVKAIVGADPDPADHPVFEVRAC